MASTRRATLLTVPEWGWTLVAVIGGVLLLWLALLAALWIQSRRVGTRVDWRAVLRLAPDVARLLRRLVADRTVPRGVRWWLIGLLAYLLMPIDLVPDFVPVIGFADDAIVAVIALRYAIRHAGADALRRNWPGTDAGLSAVLSLAGLAPDGEPPVTS